MKKPDWVHANRCQIIIKTCKTLSDELSQWNGFFFHVTSRLLGTIYKKNTLCHGVGPHPNIYYYLAGGGASHELPRKT